MKNYILLTFCIAIVALIVYSQKTDKGVPNADFRELEKDFQAWWNYHEKNIQLSTDFMGIDNFSKKISKEDFLKRLTSGDFIPLKLISKDSLVCYKLFKLDQSANSDIRQQISNRAKIGYIHFKREGIAFPKFQFFDLNGVEYNNENTKGKIVILKCWFVACHACVAEFPKLNTLVDQYRDRKDILFLSLATDPKEKLVQFLSLKKFDYAVVADQQGFITKELNVSTYPTHFLIDANGVIRKVVNKADELIQTLKAKEFQEPAQAH